MDLRGIGVPQLRDRVYDMYRASSIGWLQESSSISDWRLRVGYGNTRGWPQGMLLTRIDLGLSQLASYGLHKVELFFTDCLNRKINTRPVWDAGLVSAPVVAQVSRSLRSAQM